VVKCLCQCTRKSGVASEIWTLARTGRTPPPLKNLPLSPSPPDPLFTYLKYTSSPQFAFLHTDTLRLHFRSRSTSLSCLHRLLSCLPQAETRCYIHGPWVFTFTLRHGLLLVLAPLHSTRNLKDIHTAIPHRPTFKMLTRLALRAPMAASKRTVRFNSSSSSRASSLIEMAAQAERPCTSYTTARCIRKIANTWHSCYRSRRPCYVGRVRRVNVCGVEPHGCEERGG
jgi:hypothetical protein